MIEREVVAGSGRSAGEATVECVPFNAVIDGARGFTGVTFSEWFRYQTKTASMVNLGSRDEAGITSYLCARICSHQS